MRKTVAQVREFERDTYAHCNDNEPSFTGKVVWSTPCLNPPSSKGLWPNHSASSVGTLDGCLISPHHRAEGSGLGVEMPSLEHEGITYGSQFVPGLPQC